MNSKHTYILTLTITHTQKIPTYTHTIHPTHTNTCAHMHAYTYIQTDTQTYTHALMYPNTCVHTDTHTCTLSNMHTLGLEENELEIIMI